MAEIEEYLSVMGTVAKQKFDGQTRANGQRDTHRSFVTDIREGCIDI